MGDNEAGNQEGFLLFYDEQIAEMLHIKIWIDASLQSLGANLRNPLEKKAPFAIVLLDDWF